MSLALLFPRYLHPAIEERFAGWQNELLIRREAPEAEVHHYDPTRPLNKATHSLSADYILVLTDPLLVPSPGLPQRLLRALESSPDVAAVVPVTNESAHPQQ